MPSVWPVSEAWMKKQQCTWHWQVEAYDVSKWATAGIKGPLWNTSSSFLSSGDVCFWSVSLKRLRNVVICVSTFDNRWHTRPMRMCGVRARTLCSRGNGEHSLWAFFFEKVPLSSVPFLKRIGAILCPPPPPAAWFQPLLRQRGDWDRRDHRWSLLTSLKEELMAFCILASFRVCSSKEAWQNRSPWEHKSVLCALGIEKQPISRTRRQLTRVNCWSRMIMCCHLHRLIQHG